MINKKLIKRLIGFIAIAIWFYIMWSILKGVEGFNKQAPLCMGTTMLIFTILSLLYKGIDIWDKEKS